MTLKNKLLIYFTFLLSQKGLISSQQYTCTLPDGITQSICTGFLYCNTLHNQYALYGPWPPPNIIQYFRSHACGNTGLYCCPDNGVISSTSTTQVPTTSTTIEDRSNEFDSSPNINLININSCGISTSDRVFGGMEASLREFPWTAILGYELLENIYEWRCGGSLISLRYVLTAAHCIRDGLKIVRLGEHNRTSERDCNALGLCHDPVQDIEIEQRITYPNHAKRFGQEHDIALLKLKSAADVSKNNVKTICLPVASDVNVETSTQGEINLVITGWGAYEKRPWSDVLLKAYVPFVNHTACVAIFEPHRLNIFESFLCAGGYNKTNTCRGDSGGGLLGLAQINEKSKFTLFGITTFGNDCFNSLIVPGIYTNVKHYIKWILENISE